MSADESDARLERLDRFRADELPRLAGFLAAHLHEDWALDYASPAEAAWEFLVDADLDDVTELAGEWSVLTALSRELSLDELTELLRLRFGSGWVPTTREEIAAVQREFDRALAE